MLSTELLCLPSSSHFRLNAYSVLEWPHRFSAKSFQFWIQFCDTREYILCFCSICARIHRATPFDRRLRRKFVRLSLVAILDILSPHQDRRNEIAHKNTLPWTRAEVESHPGLAQTNRARHDQMIRAQRAMSMTFSARSVRSQDRLGAAPTIAWGDAWQRQCLDVAKRLSIVGCAKPPRDT